MEHADKALPGGITFKLFGQEYTLRPNMLTFCRFQDRTGKNPFDPLVWSDIDPKMVTALVWAAIGGEESPHSYEQVAEKLEFESLKAVNEFVVRFFKKGEVPDPPKSDAAE